MSILDRLMALSPATRKYVEHLNKMPFFTVEKVDPAYPEEKIEEVRSMVSSDAFQKYIGEMSRSDTFSNLRDVGAAQARCPDCKILLGGWDPTHWSFCRWWPEQLRGMQNADPYALALNAFRGGYARSHHHPAECNGVGCPICGKSVRS